MQNGRGNCVSANCMLHCVPIIRCECCIQRYAAQQENVHQVNFIYIPICHILAQLFFMSYHVSYQRSANILRKHSVSSLFARVCPCTCLLSTGCCSPSKRRRTPSYLASSPIHFPRKSEDKSRTSPQVAI